MRISRKLLADVFFFCVLFLSSGATEALTSSTNGADAQGSPLMKVLWAGVYLVVLCLLVPRLRQVGSLLAGNKCFVVFLLLALISVQWSVDRQATLQKSIPLLLSALIGLEFARRYTIQEQLRIIWMVLALVVFLGVVAQVCFPGLVPDTDLDADGAWNGIVTNKNTWARLIVLTGVAILSLPRRTRLSNVRVAVLMVAVIALLVASRSAGGLLIMLVAMVLSFGFRVLRWPRPRLLLLAAAMALICVAAGSYVFQNPDAAARMMGKDATMTGRVPIWRESLRFARKSPVIGYGYAAFWSQNSRPGRLIREATNWDSLPHAHNGYIDLMLQLGAAGLVLYFASYLIAVKRAALLVRTHKQTEFKWPLTFLCVVFLYQLNEASIVSANQLIWILYSTVLFSLTFEAQRGELPVAEEDPHPAAGRVALAAGD